MKKTTLSLFAVLICFSLMADVKLPQFFGAHMVLQRGKAIPVWGWANPKEKVTVQFNHQTKTTKADKAGRWMVRLDPETAGGPYNLMVNGKNAITVPDVYVGEVWICSGQSNMEMPIEGWGKINHYQEEIAAANFPLIRHIKVPNTVGTSPREDITGGEWEICSPSTAGDFTAVGYFFARELYHKLNIPIGLINTSWGGTMVETWTSKEAFESSDEFKDMIAALPSLNLDSLSKARTAAARQKIADMQGSLNATDAATWKEPGTPDGNWPQMSLPGLWESRGLAGVDGVVWFRKTVTVPAGDAGKPATLSLAMIDDNDITYINGTKVGTTNSYNEKRNYTIPAGVLKAGENVIAIRVEDTGGGGGLYGEGEALQLTVGERTIALSGDWRFKVENLVAGSTSIGPNSYPTLLFNAMVNPLIPYAIEGVIWYQGEANAGRAYQYSKAFPLMINDWRSRWKQGDFPFYFVQLASFNAGNGNSEKGSSWAELREAQTNTLSLPNTGMAVTTDIGNPTDIHPKNKQDVGKRLAAIALHQVYGENNVYSGPVYQSMKTNGNKVTISFTHTGTGLMVKDKYGYLKGFEIAGADKQFHYAKAYIDGDKVVVYADEVRNPVAVRYGWCDFAGDDNLFNKEGFPAGPFRTDNWKGITEETKYTINN